MTTVRIRRDAETLAIPYGSAMVAGIGAAALAVVGLIIPIFWIESAAFQLYLDTILAAAVPPLGYGARILAVLALAFVGAIIGLTLAKLFGVVSNGVTFGDLLAQLRGVGSDDDFDAPALRAADRHPDAPARRPFSAATDIPSRDADDDDGGLMLAPMRAMVRRDADPLLDARDDDHDDDELLLDAHFSPAGEDIRGPAPIADDEWDALRKNADPAPDDDQPARVVAVAHDADRFDHDDRPDDDRRDDDRRDDDDQHDGEAINLSPPQLDDWDIIGGGLAAEPESAQMVSEVSAAQSQTQTPAQISAQTPAQIPAPNPAPPPLDLSVARLDQLLARLEAGLVRKAALSIPPAVDAPLLPDAPAMAATSQFAGVAPLVTGANDPAFPQDPALAAALATLRRLNQQAG